MIVKSIEVRVETKNGIHFTVWHGQLYYCNLNKHGVGEKIKELIQDKLEVQK